MEKIFTDIKLGDNKEILKSIHDNYVDLIVTSPPYADRRKNTYGGIPHDEYVEWFKPISLQLLRVLKPTGSFILNIKENVVEGERSTYVMELIMDMRKHGWLWIEEYIWYKKNSMPGKWTNRFKDEWERLLHFTKNNTFNMYQEAVMKKAKYVYNKKEINENDTIRRESKTGSGFGSKNSNMIGREKVYPGNVLHLSTESNNYNHSAVFPEKLPEWFIKLFTKPYDVVLDPFMGSGTTLVAANRLNRSSIGIEIIPEYIEVAKKRLDGVVNQLELL